MTDLHARIEEWGQETLSDTSEPIVRAWWLLQDCQRRIREWEQMYDGANIHYEKLKTEAADRIRELEGENAREAVSEALPDGTTGTFDDATLTFEQDE